jgi:DUF917 family protein
MTAAAGPEWAEKVFRAACTEMGCSVGLASTPMTGKRAKEVCAGLQQLLGMLCQGTLDTL